MIRCALCHGTVTPPVGPGSTRCTCGKVGYDKSSSYVKLYGEYDDIEIFSGGAWTPFREHYGWDETTGKDTANE